MNKFFKTATVLLSACVALGAVGCNNQTNNSGGSGGSTGGAGEKLPTKTSWTVSSPDATIKSVVGIDVAGNVYYEVSKDNVTVVDRSTLGFTIKEDDFRFYTLEGAKTNNVSGSYETKSGKNSTVDYECNELTVTLKAWDFYLDVIMRTYDDGYAFRYGIRAIDGGAGTVTVVSENSEFALPQNSTVWSQDYTSNSPERGDFFSYEETYTKKNSTGDFKSVTTSMPLLYRVKGKEIYSLITESDLIGSGFYGSFLKESKGYEGTGRFQTVHTPAGITYPDNVISYPFESPWRVGITGSLATVQESDLVEKVYDDVEYWKPDDYESLSPSEQAIYNYDWVEPGVVAWNWLIYSNAPGEKKPQNDWAMQREYVDLAVKMGWKYTILDGGWNANFNETTFRSFMDYADSKRIKVIVWCDALNNFGNGNIELLRSKLDEWKSYGVAGIKIDFFDGQTAYGQRHQGEDIGTIKWYESIFQETAKRQMIVNPHGSNKPTGERRLYPNVINREGIRGYENISVGSTSTINALFIRGVVGPTDFTPVVNPLSDNISKAHLMALAVLFESGTPSMADYSAAYNELKIQDFYKNIPSSRDETRFLGGELDRYYVGAIRCGDTWFVCGVNTLIKRDVEIDFSFLGEGKYEAEIFTDNGLKDVNRKVIDITKDNSETISMIANGGFAMRITKK